MCSNPSSVLTGLSSRRLTALWLALGFAGIALTLRATVDHSFVTLYTGDNGEELTLAAARNFQKSGFVALKFLPVHHEIGGAEVSLAPRYYTHSPPLPPLLVGVSYALSGDSIFFSRLVVVFITLVGIVYATLSARDLAESLVPEGAAGRVAAIAMPLLLATSASTLCYGDALSEVPIQETWQWMLLFYCVRFLREPGNRGLHWLGALSALQIWTALDWILPNMAVLAWCVLAKPLSNKERWRAFLVVHGLGMVVPLCLRLAQNAWALGGLTEAFQDLFQRALFRSVGDDAYPYSLSKHIAHFGVAMIWLCGLAAPLLVWLDSRTQVRGRLQGDARLARLFTLWGLGSLSFQLVMPQASMYHAYTALHPANFVLLWGALAAARLWESRPFAVGAALALQLLWGGAVFVTEVGTPFLRDSSMTLARQLCAGDQAALSQAIPDMSSSVSKLIGGNLAGQMPAAECGARSAAARTVLWVYLRVIRVSSLD
jgi:hypothetical protein